MDLKFEIKYEDFEGDEFIEYAKSKEEAEEIATELCLEGRAKTYKIIPLRI